MPLALAQGEVQVVDVDKMDRKSQVRHNVARLHPLPSLQTPSCSQVIAGITAGYDSGRERRKLGCASAGGATCSRPLLAGRGAHLPARLCAPQRRLMERVMAAHGETDNMPLLQRVAARLERWGRGCYMGPRGRVGMQHRGAGVGPA